MDNTIKYMFYLGAILLILAYYSGFSTDAGAFASAVTALVYAVTGRDTQGQFAQYPGGGSSGGGKKSGG